MKILFGKFMTGSCTTKGFLVVRTFKSLEVFKEQNALMKPDFCGSYIVSSSGIHVHALSVSPVEI